jgi:hypothetical protein
MTAASVLLLLLLLLLLLRVTGSASTREQADAARRAHQYSDMVCDTPQLYQLY